MDKQQIMQLIAKEKKVEEIISNVTKTQLDDNLIDLAQDIYLTLLDKDDKLIEDLYNNNQLIFYITRIVINNLKSTTSQFYYKYLKYDLNKISLDGIRKDSVDKRGNEDDS